MEVAMGLTPLQQRFVEEYLVDLNATAAACRAGYAQQGRHAWYVMESAAVRAAIQEALADRAKRIDVEAYQVIDALRAIAFAPESEIKAKERLAAISMLAKHLGMFADRPAGGGERALSLEEALAQMR
jgi:phage terminase small subunit